MIYTCTITPSIDYTVYLPAFENGKLNRSEEVYYYPGGKGINVSRVLNRLGVESQALGFTGGFTGSYIESFLQKEGVATDFIETSQITRINIKIKSEKETELNGPGPQLTEQQLMILTNKVKAMKKGDWFILAGSLPGSIPDSYFLDLAKICSENGVRFVLDTSGPALKKLTNVPCFLIKPNLDELGELFDTKITDIKAAHFYAKRLLENDIRHVIVSMDADGALLVTKNLSLSAKAPIGTVINTVGSGDSLVSGFIASYSKDENPEKAFRYGVASGSATAFRSDLCDQQGVEALLEQVEITPI
ncbi:1-phosphofructokinase [Psychrobacillus psychrodurans]|uniref:1-phosphofructokinase n=1 Tax=Psychrobacillus psychrodurans TaxID=126157 RepID=UPI0008E7E552|nr:1-phosphofructokinase [Psychrobacillus psychrodurans]MCZ8539157.1 1-phosphofructokinase [Psychrobacillus psychrodurans]SFM29267.1 1-phosphofructokinase [Psychrobacillus psychrodurans]